MQSTQGFGRTSESRRRLARLSDTSPQRASSHRRAPLHPAPLHPAPLHPAPLHPAPLPPAPLPLAPLRPRRLNASPLNSSALRASSLRAFTLIELLIVVAIIVILAAIAVPNFLRAQERALIAKDMSQMRSIGAALQMYHVDFNNWPPADARAGGFQSHGDGNAFGNAPAAGGNWSAVPWVLYDLGYVENPETLFCPKYFRKFSGGKTIQNEEGQPWPRYHNFRYAYNASALSQFGDYVTFGDSTGPTMNNEGWILRDVFLDADLIRNDFGAEPAFEWDYPWGEGDNAGKVELMMRIDMRIMPVFGREAFADEDVPTPPGVF